MNELVYEYEGKLFPYFLKQGNAMQYVIPYADKLCRGVGLDIGSSKWPLPGAIPIELEEGGDAMNLPEGPFDFIASSHCLEHLQNPVAALEHWKTRIRPGGVLLLSLPHPSMSYWLPQNNRKHLHTWTPEQMRKLVEDMGFVDVLNSERDLFWSFQVVGFKPGADHVG